MGKWELVVLVCCLLNDVRASEAVSTYLTTESDILSTPVETSPTSVRTTLALLGGIAVMVILCSTAIFISILRFSRRFHRTASSPSDNSIDNATNEDGVEINQPPKYVRGE